MEIPVKYLDIEHDKVYKGQQALVNVPGSVHIGLKGCRYALRLYGFQQRLCKLRLGGQLAPREGNAASMTCSTVISLPESTSAPVKQLLAQAPQPVQRARS